LVTAGKQPEWVAISSGGSGTFAYAPNFGDGSISQYTIGSDGKLQAAGVANSALLTNPFSAAAAGSFLYVSDYGNGTIVSFPINQDGTLAAASASSTDSSSQSTRNPYAMLLDPNQNFVYVSDKTTGYVSVFATAGGALSGFIQSVAPIVQSGAAGIAIASLSNGHEFLYAANSAANSISLYRVSGAGELTPVAIVAQTPSSPAGLVVGTGDSGRFLYAASRDRATITRFAITSATGLLGAPEAVGTGNGPLFLIIPGA
jgi:6-phosphogluconolactonase